MYFSPCEVVNKYAGFHFETKFAVFRTVHIFLDEPVPVVVVCIYPLGKTQPWASSN